MQMYSLYALEFAQNGQTVTVVAEDTCVLILLVYHWRKTQGKQALKTRRKVQHDRGYQLETTCYPEAYYVHSCMKYLGHNVCNLRSWKDVFHGNVEPGIRSTELALLSK